MIHADVAATTRSVRPEGEETGDGTPRRHRRSQGRPVAAVPPVPVTREWFATTANGAAPRMTGHQWTEDPLITAYHEAGHVVAYLAQRRRFRYVTIRARGAIGRVAVRPVKCCPFGLLTRVYAGPLAEALCLLGGPPAAPAPLELPDFADIEYQDEEDDGDRETAVRLRHRLEITGDPDLWHIIALRLVTDQWRTVETIASALAERHTLTYREVLDLPGMAEARG